MLKLEVQAFPLPVITLGGQEYMRNSLGALVPKEQVKPIDLARTELVLELVNKALALNQTMSELKHEMMADVEAFASLSAERHGVKLGGIKGNLSLTSFDGEYEIKRQISEQIVFDEGLQAAKALIDECLREWTRSGPSELKAIIDGAFRVDREGRINTARILGLRNHDIKDERWQRAMNAISESIQVAGSRAYLRVYRRDKHGKMVAIPLDMAAL